MNRRDFVRLMGLASGASLLNSCGLERQSEKIIPYLVPPDDGVLPGQATYTSTTCTECPAGCGVAAKTMDNRVGKLEGLAGHPINDGALCMRGQASLARLYHPDRLTQPLLRDSDGSFTPVSWDEAYSLVIDAMKSGNENAFLSGRTTGTLSALIDRFCRETGVKRLPEFEMFSYAAIREANRIVLGRAEVPSYRIEDADFVLTVGADIFETFVSPISHAMQFGRAKEKKKFDWYHAEPHASLTGMQAKHRYVISPGSEPYLLTFLLRKVSRANLAGDRHIAGLVESLPNLSMAGYAEKTGLSTEALDDLAAHLLAARKPLVITGGVSTMHEQGLETAVMTALLQWALGMVGTTVDFSSAEDYSNVGTLRDIQQLTRRLNRGRVGVLFVTRTEPLQSLPESFGVAEAMKKAGFRVGFGEFMTTTMEACNLVLPLSNTLESWGDSSSKRGMMGVIQPVIEPLHDTLTEGDILLQLSGRFRGRRSAATYQEHVFNQWRDRFTAREVGRFLDAGFSKSRSSMPKVRLNRGALENFLRAMKVSEPSSKPALVLAPSMRFYDGRSGDLPLMHEIPDPLTTISWGGWVSVSEETARELSVEDMSEVVVTAAGWSAELPVKVQQGLARGVMTIDFGAVHPVPIGVDQSCGEPVVTFADASVQRTGKVVAIPILSGSQSQEGRGVVPKASHGDDAHHHDLEATLYPEKVHPDYRWGMAIDLDLCIGCSACSAACYVENNVPITGREDHLLGREMSWIRIEPFYEDGGEADFQPMLCQHCTNAPCESVCPVFATYHNPEGLNAQVYNRCVGTRYCANNCPYKVRRFNWFDYNRPSQMNLTTNPSVSVRGRGVMEKCTFCVQRIRSARDVAKDEKRKIRDNEVTPACAQSCPTHAIKFGDLQDEQSDVYKWATSDRSYRVFEQLGTGPAVYYLRNKWKSDHA